MKEKIDYINKVINHASKAINFLVPIGTITTNTTRILTGYSAISIPKEEEELVSKDK